MDEKAMQIKQDAVARLEREVQFYEDEAESITKKIASMGGEDQYFVGKQYELLEESARMISICKEKLETARRNVSVGSSR
ncbi:MAG: tubulin-specific chaperone A [Amphiamblys sp. WSBS2006]|nr:MAG: tubulin-specific chaperone A [Amphiamblys sp. WSBS2006]